MAQFPVMRGNAAGSMLHARLLSHKCFPSHYWESYNKILWELSHKIFISKTLTVHAPHMLAGTNSLSHPNLLLYQLSYRD